MDKHLEALVHPHVEVDVPVGRPGVAIFQAANFQRQGLLVQSTLVQVGGVDFLVDAWGNHIGDRLANPVFFQVHRRECELRPRWVVHFDLLESGQALLIPAPLATHQFDARKAQGHRLLPALHKHPHEPDGTEIADAVERLLVFLDRDLELVPLDGTLFSRPVGLGDRLQNVCEVALANVVGRQIRRGHRDLVLVVRLDGAQGQILVDVLRVGNRRLGDGVPVGLLGVGIALIAAEELITLEDILLVFLGNGVPEVAEVVGRGVVLVLGKGVRRQVRFQPIKPRGKKGPFGVGVQPIKAHILNAVIVGAVVKGIHHVERGRVGIHTPCAGVGFQLVVGRGQTVLEFKLAVVQHVLADVAQVDIQFAPSLVLRILIERVHDPKLDVLDVRRLEVGGHQGALHPGPSCLRVKQGAVLFQPRRIVRPVKRLVVVGAPFRRTVGQVQGRQVGRHSRGGTVAVVALLIEFTQQDLTHAVVLAHLGVHLAVLQRAAVDERWIDGVPAQTCPVVVGRGVVFQTGLGEATVLPTRRRRQEPPVDGAQVNRALGPLKIVDVRCALVPHRAAVPWNQVSAFRRDVEGGLRRRVVEGQPVDELCQQAALGLPRKVGPNHRVVHGLVPHVHLPGQRPLAHVQQGGPNVEIVAGHVIESCAQEGLRLNVEERV